MGMKKETTNCSICGEQFYQMVEDGMPAREFCPACQTDTMISALEKHHPPQRDLPLPKCTNCGKDFIRYGKSKETQCMECRVLDKVISKDKDLKLVKGRAQRMCSMCKQMFRFDIVENKEYPPRCLSCEEQFKSALSKSLNKDRSPVKVCGNCESDPCECKKPMVRTCPSCKCTFDTYSSEFIQICPTCKSQGKKLNDIVVESINDKSSPLVENNLADMSIVDFVRRVCDLGLVVDIKLSIGEGL